MQQGLEPAQTQNLPVDKTSKRNRQGIETKHRDEEKKRNKEETRKRQEKEKKREKKREERKEKKKGKKIQRKQQKEKRERVRERERERERDREREKEREKKNKENNTARTPTKGKTRKETRKGAFFKTLRNGNKIVTTEFARHSLQPSKPKVIHPIRNCKNLGNLDVNVARMASTVGSSAPTLAKAVQETEIRSINLTY